MINDFNGDNYFLNNFFPCEIILDESTKISSVANGYYGLIAESYSDRVKIFNSYKPQIALAMGLRLIRTGKVRKDFNSIHMTIMKSLLTRKFEISELREKLLATGDELLLNNTIHDKYWGTIIEDGHYIGYNHLGKLLMQIRAELLD